MLMLALDLSCHCHTVPPPSDMHAASGCLRVMLPTVVRQRLAAWQRKSALVKPLRAQNPCSISLQPSSLLFTVATAPVASVAHCWSRHAGGTSAAIAFVTIQRNSVSDRDSIEDSTLLVGIPRSDCDPSWPRRLRALPRITERMATISGPSTNYNKEL